MKQNTLFAALAATVMLAGCSLMPSPAVGEWSGAMTAAPQGGAMGALAAGMLGAAGGANAELTLKSDGTGYIKAMSAPERPITWKMDGDRVLIAGTEGFQNGSKEGIVARLSEDKKTMNVDMGVVQFALTKKEK
ncbi:MAG: hypothetical protein H7Y38_13205 [Armatimonadetes bacterium]|nr:hypothetical protein [Armatimonadota bacterium]